MERIRIAHITTVHPRGDTRIRVRELASIADAGPEPVVLFVQDGNGDAIEAGGSIRILDTGPVPGGRLARMTQGVWRMWRAVRSLQPRLAHFHDPELIPLGLLLKCFGHRVVYDVHEDLPRQVLTKYWLPGFLRRPVSWIVSAIEWLAARVLDSIVPATPKIAERFPPRKTTTIQNFPILDELVEGKVIPYPERPAQFAYIGGLTRERGACEMVNALNHIQTSRLCLAGAFQPADLQTELEALPGWQRVVFAGWANRIQVAEILGNARAGLVVLHPTRRYPDAYPTKMFEYMSVGLPVIVSDFPLWRRIVDDAGCGLLVDPLDPQAIADAMQWILDHPAQAEAMGRRGREAVENNYNWETEARKLAALYNKLLRA
ncbi:MAG: glycosyltransferase family 4 protein [Gammaproteobacteria bacterium]|nr:glycosyltransferase family 4 protein [Gammaproteobacteria bacterium]